MRDAIITIHGTNDGAEDQDRRKWWQVGSPFAERLIGALSAAGISAEVVPFRWSGANNVLERERAAERLAATIKKCAKQFNRIHLIGHSHGGNVANDAAIYLRWGKQRRGDRITSLTTVGAPFLKSPVTAFQRGGAFAFLGIAIVGAMVLVGVSLWSIVASAAQGPNWSTASVTLILVVGGVAFYFMLREALQGFRRVSRPALNPGAHASLFCIWHPADEAISVLRAAGGLEIEPFARGAILLGSRTGGILWAVRIVIAFVVAALAFLIASLVGLGGAVETLLGAIGLAPFGHWINAPDGLGLRRDEPTTYIVVLATVLGAAAALWLATYFTFRLFFGVLPEIGARGYANRSLREIFRGMAFGSVGDQRPAAVDVCSYAFPCERMELSGELAERLRDKARESANRFIEKYRWQFFDVSANHAELFSKIPQDVMTWKSLIHTTYFDEPEIADTIAKHIIQRATPGATPAATEAMEHDGHD